MIVYDPQLGQFIKKPSEPSMPSINEEEMLSKREIQNTLRRLLDYYGTRAKVVRKMLREGQDGQSAFEYVTSVLRWEAKHDAILKVAENLEIELECEL